MRLRPLVFARRRLGGGQLFPTRREFLVDVHVISVRSRALVRVRIGERSIMGVHHCHRPERAGAHGDARDEQLRERKRSRSSSIALVGGTAFDGIVGRHDARTSAWTSGASVRGCPRWIFRQTANHHPTETRLVIRRACIDARARRGIGFVRDDETRRAFLELVRGGASRGRRRSRATRPSRAVPSIAVAHRIITSSSSNLHPCERRRVRIGGAPSCTDYPPILRRMMAGTRAWCARFARGGATRMETGRTKCSSCPCTNTRTRRKETI